MGDTLNEGIGDEKGMGDTFNEGVGDDKGMGDTLNEGVRDDKGMGDTFNEGIDTFKEGVASRGGRHCKECGFKFLHGADDTWRVGGDESNEESDNS